MRKTLHTAALGCLISTLVIVAGGCGAGNGAENGPRSQSAPSPPFQRFLREELARVEFALSEKTAQCMAEAGYPQLREHGASSPEPSFDHLAVTPKTLLPENAAEAAASGFGTDSPTAPPNIVSYDKRYDAEKKRCSAAAHDKLAPDSNKVINQYYRLGNRISDDFSQALDKVRSRFKEELLECVVQAGYKRPEKQDDKQLRLQDFDIERGAPEKSKSDVNWEPDPDKSGVQVGPAAPAREYVPTPEESEFAATTFRCKKNIGEHRALRESVIPAQRSIVQQYSDSLDRLNPRIKEFESIAGEMLRNLPQGE